MLVERLGDNSFMSFFFLVFFLLLARGRRGRGGFFFLSLFFLLKMTEHEIFDKQEIVDNVEFHRSICRA